MIKKLQPDQFLRTKQKFVKLVPNLKVYFETSSRLH